MADRVQVINRSRPGDEGLTAERCTTFFCKFRGLMFRRSLPPNWGLLFVHPRESRLDAAIHMLWMWIDLAVIWVNSAGRVVDVQHARRWQPLLMPARPARYVLETSVDHLSRFKVGDELEFKTLPHS